MPKAQVPADELEALIVQAVRRHDGCKEFQSIVLQRRRESHAGNWATGSENYGSASPEKCKKALSEILPKMQHHYDLMD